MHGVAVTLLTEENERLSVLQHRLDGTQMGRNVFSHVGFPAGPTDPVLRQIQDVRSEVVLVDIDPHNVQRAISAIELINSNTSDIAIFAVGEMTHPPTIVAAMRAGAREYLERNATSEAILEALTRFATSRSKTRTSSGRARVFTVTNA
jgi:DNA-binding NarL/FixJ family response regulator